jgi:hypothetical protein
LLCGITTVTVASPDWLGSCTLLAVTVELPVVFGAVNCPVEEIVPRLELHVTAEL